MSRMRQQPGRGHWGAGLAAVWVLAACGHTAQPPSQAAYQGQTLAIHAYRVQVPAEVDLGRGLEEAVLHGHVWRPHPLASARAFAALVQGRARALDAVKLNAQAVRQGRRQYPERPGSRMRSALYQTVRVDAHRQAVIGNGRHQLRQAAPAQLYAEWFVRRPGSKTYVHGQQAALPPGAEPAAQAQAFLARIRAAEPGAVPEAGMLAVGPVWWQGADAPMRVRYRLSAAGGAMMLKIGAWTDERAADALQQQQATLAQRLAAAHAQAVLQRPTRAAGLPGQEDCVLQTPNAGQWQLWCRWHNTATAGQPQLGLEMTYRVGDAAQANHALAVWQQLLGSLQRRN